MGTALTIRDLIGERTIFRREQAVGLSTTAYLLAKIARVRGVRDRPVARSSPASRVVGKGAPTRARGRSWAVRPWSCSSGIAATCVAAAMVGLALSALAQVNEQIMPLLVVAIMAQLVFSGGLIPVTGRVGARPDVVVHAGAVGLRGLGVDGRPDQPGAGAAAPQGRRTGSTRRRPGCSTWACSARCAVVYTGFVRWKIRLTSRALAPSVASCCTRPA